MTKLTILIIPFEAYGHIYPAVGVGQQLLQKGHRVVFLIEKSWKGKLAKYGFEEEFLPGSEAESKKAQENFINFVKDTGYLENKSPIEKAKTVGVGKVLNKLKTYDVRIDEVVNNVKPDVTIADIFMITPSVVKTKPWINLFTANPVSIKVCDELPPPFSGLPSNDRSKWKEFKEVIEETRQNQLKLINKWFNSLNLKAPISEDDWFCSSPYLNLYSYPKELDYSDVRTIPKNWFRFDTFIRNESQPFMIPDKLKDKPGKLIFFSLGSIGSIDVNLMKKLTGYLSESPHRFIVSKGILGDEYQLPDNCWGENHVPQTKILEIVDLAIIHGGNNSLCETFYFGKPMIVMPLFVDQFDNAQRVDEKGFGIRIDPYKCSKEQLLNTIEKLLNDEDLTKKLKEVAKRIDEDIKSNKLVEIIENLCKNIS